MKTYSLLIAFIVLSVSCENEKRKKMFSKKIYDTEYVTQIIKGDSANLLFGKGEEFFNEAEYDSARKYLRMALEKESNPVIYNELGLLEFELQNTSNSITYHTQGIEVDSTYYSNFINLGKVHLHLSNYHEAKKILNKVIIDTKSPYWKAVANLYVATVLTNNLEDCNTIKLHIEEAQLLEKDEDFEDFYKLVTKNFKNNCN